MCKVHVLAHSNWTHFSELKYLELCHCTANIGMVSGFPKLHGTAKLLWSIRDFFPTHPSLASTRDEESQRSKYKLRKIAEGWQLETKSTVVQFSSFHEEKLTMEPQRLNGDFIFRKTWLSASHISNGEKDVPNHLITGRNFCDTVWPLSSRHGFYVFEAAKEGPDHKLLSVQQILRCYCALSTW